MYVYMYVSSNRVTVPTVATLRYIVLYYMKTGLRSVMQTAAQRYQLHQSIYARCLQTCMQTIHCSDAQPRQCCPAERYATGVTSYTQRTAHHQNRQRRCEVSDHSASVDEHIKSNYTTLRGRQKPIDRSINCSI